MIGAQSRRTPVVASHCIATGQAAASGDAQAGLRHALLCMPSTYARPTPPSLIIRSNGSYSTTVILMSSDPEVQAAGGGKTAWPHLVVEE
jgi:hypothetical protein